MARCIFGEGVAWTKEMDHRVYVLMDIGDGADQVVVILRIPAGNEGIMNRHAQFAVDFGSSGNRSAFSSSRICFMME